jgi:hypothetical protein
MKCIPHRCDAGPANCCATASFDPAYASKITKCTADQPRTRKPTRNSRQKSNDSLPPTAVPNTSLVPSIETPIVAMWGECSILARVVVYYVLTLALFASDFYEEVTRKLVADLDWASGGPHEWSIPTKAALFQALKRLGSEPLRVLYEKVAVPLADPQVPGGFYRSWQLMSDGLTLDVPDCEANVEYFGRPPSSRGDGRGRSVSAKNAAARRPRILQLPAMGCVPIYRPQIWCGE